MSVGIFFPSLFFCRSPQILSQGQSQPSVRTWRRVGVCLGGVAGGCPHAGRGQAERWRRSTEAKSSSAAGGRGSRGGGGHRQGLDSGNGLRAGLGRKLAEVAWSPTRLEEVVGGRRWSISRGRWLLA
jgi:hypothetical protein